MRLGKVALASIVVAGLCFAACSGLRDQEILIDDGGAGPAGGEGQGGSEPVGGANQAGSSTAVAGQPD